MMEPLAKRLKSASDAILSASGEGYNGLYWGHVVDDTDDQNHGGLGVYVYGVSPVVYEPLANMIVDKKKIPHIRCFPSLPSFGTTLIDGGTINDEAMSYGFWGPQPRLGDAVLVGFVGGSLDYPIWMGCLPRALNCMTMPGLPAMDIEGETDYLPGKERSTSNPKTKTHSPAGVIVENLKISGLANDLLRGAGISGMTRETPSRVTGIKTRGNGVNGMAGHTFVMDDLPETQGIRLRTSTGHQILLSDAGQSIYVSTSQGNCRIELYDSGDIDMFSEGKVSLHASGDLNLVTGGNLNLDVGKDMNVKVAGAIKMQAAGNLHMKATGSSFIESVGAMNLSTQADAKFTSVGTTHIKATDQVRMQSSGDMHLKSGPFLYMDAATKVQSSAGLSQDATAATAATAPTTVSLPGSKTVEQSQSGTEAGNIQTVASKVPQREPYKTPGRIIETALRVPEHGEPSPFDFDEHELARRLALGLPLKSTAGLSPFEANAGAGKDPSEGQVIPRQNVKYLIVHSSAQPASAVNADKALIEGWHRKMRNVGNRLAYHFIIKRDGTIEEGVPVVPQLIHGNHAGDAAINRMSVGICMIGGAKAGNLNVGEANFTPAQMTSLRRKLTELKALFPSVQVICGHRDVKPSTACPSFDVQTWWKSPTSDIRSLEKKRTPLPKIT